MLKNESNLQEKNKDTPTSQKNKLKTKPFLKKNQKDMSSSQSSITENDEKSLSLASTADEKILLSTFEKNKNTILKNNKIDSSSVDKGNENNDQENHEIKLPYKNLKKIKNEKLKKPSSKTFSVKENNLAARSIDKRKLSRSFSVEGKLNQDNKNIGKKNLIDKEKANDFQIKKKKLQKRPKKNLDDKTDDKQNR